MANGLLANAHESNTDLLWVGSGGFDTVYHDDTLTGLGTELYPLGVNSAYLNDTPWLSAAKEIAPTQTLQPGQYIQALSSLTVSGYKNHCVAVKGGGFVFPTTDQLKEWVGTDYYLLTSSFENYTAYNENNISSLYNSASNLINSSYYLIDNKLDKSAFNEWSANLDLSGDYIPTSASGFFYPMTGNPSGFLTEHQDLSDYATTSIVNNISSYLSGEIDNKLDKSESGNYYPMTGNPSGFLTAHQSLTNYYTKTDTSSKQEISAAIQYVSANAGKTYSGINPIVVNNTTNQISADTWLFSAGNGISFVDDNENKVTRIDCTVTGGSGAIYTGISPIDVNNTTHQISAKGVSFGVQSPLYFVQDDNEAVIIGCSASGGGGTTYTGDAQGALDEVYANSGVWLTAHQDISNLMPKSESANFYPMTGNPSGFLTSHQDLSYISGKIDDKLDTTALENLSGEFYPMTGNPSGFLTAHQSLTNYYTKTDTSSKQELSAALQYISSNAGHTYTGDDPIYVNNVTDHIGITGESLSAGPNIDIFSSGGYVVISATGGVVPGFNETVLWEGTATSASWPITLSESTNNFESFKIEWCPYTENTNWFAPYDIVNTKLNNGTLHLFGQGIDTAGAYGMLSNLLISANNNELTKKQFMSITMYNSNVSVGKLEGYRIYKVIGINRKE